MNSNLSIRWVGADELERVAETRWLCYAHAAKDLERFKEDLRERASIRPGDFVLAEHGGRPVGTATSLNFTMWVRGTPLPCQGVAYVGAVKTDRRRGGGSPGVATRVMNAVLDMARQREMVVSALMPFRASFYEHFGYGNVETRACWTVPLSILPDGSSDGWMPATASDELGQVECHLRQTRAGQCDIERSKAVWIDRAVKEDGGLRFVRRASDAMVDAHLFMTVTDHDGKRRLDVEDWGADSPAAFARLLCFLGSLRDQYFDATIRLPADWPLNTLLRQSHVNLRQFHYPTAEVKLMTRMQARILDHRRFLEAVKWPAIARGRTTVTVHEPEGSKNTFRLDVEEKTASVKASRASADFECDAKTWAAVACGEMPASAAMKWGLATGKPAAITLLDGLSNGPKPFCHEYF